MGFEKNSFGAIPSIGGIQLFDGIQSTQNATSEIAGLMSAEDKAKIDSLQNYVHPDSGVKAGKYMQVEVNEQGHVTGGRTLQEGTLADYGIIDAYIDLTDNSITIGPNRVKPLTPSDKIRWEQMVDTPDTLAGYGIVDAKITDEGVIQLGLMTIKPLTAESDLNTDRLVGVIKDLNLPNKLADYGITDITIKDGTINIGGDLITPLTAESKLAADKIEGVIDLAHIPKGAMERCVVVDDDNARFALTIDDVQKGDTVKVAKPTPIMYIVVDDDNLDNAAGYVDYPAGNASSVPWSGITGKPATYYTLPPADINTLGGIMVGANLSIAPDGTLSTHAPYVLPEATANTLGGVKVGANIEVQGDGTISVPNATANVAGVVKAGNNINIGADGTISGIAYNLPVATATELGGIKIGQNVETLGDGTLNIPIASEAKAGVVKLGGNITVDSNGVLNAPDYQLPIATALRLGGIKVGRYLSVDSEGLLNATGVPTVATKEDLGGVIIGDNIDVDIDGKISVALPSKLSQLVNDVGYISNENKIELFTKVQPTYFYTSGTYTVPDQVTTIYVSGCAAGGGGSFCGGGGGGESVLRKQISVTPGEKISITIGTGGNASESAVGHASVGSTTVHNAGSGGDTVFGSYFTLKGGYGIVYNSSAAETQMPLGGGNGATNGEMCSLLRYNSSTSMFWRGGKGGDSLFGRGGTGGSWSVGYSLGATQRYMNGADGIGYGSGGGGCGSYLKSSTNYWSGAGSGANGFIMIEVI